MELNQERLIDSVLLGNINPVVNLLVLTVQNNKSLTEKDKVKMGKILGKIKYLSNTKANKITFKETE